MEQTRMLIAIVLSFVILLLWQKFFVPETPVHKKDSTQTESATNEAPYKKANESTAFQGNQQEEETVEQTVGTSEPAKEIAIETDYFIAVISEKGAALKSVKLKNYKETIQKDSPLKEVLDTTNPHGTLLCSFNRNSLPKMATAVYRASVSTEKIVVSNENVEIPFVWSSKTGVVIEKRFVFSPKSYLIDLVVNIKNGSENQIQDQLTVSLIDAIPNNPRRIGHTGPSAMLGHHVTQFDMDDLAENNSISGKINWMAFQQRYFMTGLLPEPETDGTLRFVSGFDKRIESQMSLDETIIRPETQQAYVFHGYFGPKNIGVLRSIGKDLDKVVDFGWFSFLARPCLWLMNFMYAFIPNYGIAIIILTVLMKIVLWPLGNKSYKSMSQMKKMQPLMAEIREKYKTDKQRMNQEMMSLYRTYKVNPLGGCLPMVLQIPIFFALYRMLYEAIELRHAPFFGWINDLSAPDRLFHFGVKIPFMEPPYGIPVLTIIMGATMLLQQKMQPPMGDPAQAKMMMFMPVIFTVIFINFSSGLVLYWLVSNVLSIAQQYYVTKKTA